MMGTTRGQAGHEDAGRSRRARGRAVSTAASEFAQGPGTPASAAAVLALQRSAGNGAVHGLLSAGRGRRLEGSVRAEMEARFGQDFRAVRVHDDAEAAGSAESLSAKAYTVGNDVVFSRGRYAPGTAEGKRLLAHELAHVVQQSRGGPAPTLDSGSPLEQAADRVSEGIGREAGAISVGGASGVGVARQDDDPPKPFDPQEGHWFVKWLLYGKDTPIRDALTSDRNLQVAQDVSAGVALGAATIATGGLAAEAAAGLGAGTVTAGAIGGATGGVFQTAAKGAYEGKDPSAEDYLKGAVIGAAGGGFGAGVSEAAAGLGAAPTVANVLGGASGGVYSTAVQGAIEGRDPSASEYLQSTALGAGLGLAGAKLAGSSTGPSPGGGATVPTQSEVVPGVVEDIPAATSAGSNESGAPVSEPLASVAPEEGAQASVAPSSGSAAADPRVQLNELEAQLDSLRGHPDADRLMDALDAADAMIQQGDTEGATSLLQEVGSRVQAAQAAAEEGGFSSIYGGAEDGNVMEYTPTEPSGAGTPVRVDATAPAPDDVTGQRLLGHVQDAVARFETEGFTPAQEQALQDNPQLEAAFRGSRIDAFAKEAVSQDPELPQVITTGNFEPGADLLSAENWYDMTTKGAWKAHVEKYGPWGTRLPTEPATTGVRVSPEAASSDPAVSSELASETTGSRLRMDADGNLVDLDQLEAAQKELDAEQEADAAEQARKMYLPLPEK